MATKKTDEAVTATAAAPEKKKFKVINGSVLGEHVEGFKPEAKARSWQHKRYLKGSTIALDEKDAKALVAQGVVGPIK